jgi:hypothetical protein
MLRSLTDESFARRRPTFDQAIKKYRGVDLKVFAPVSDHFMQRYRVKLNPWHNFEWLATKTEKYMAEKESAAESLQGD